MSQRPEVVYFFSGLGADERVFRDIQLPGYQLVFVKWIAPLGRESIESYARRLARQVTTNKPTLIGLSFGGLMALEVAKLVDAGRVILLALVKTRAEVPWYFRLVGALRLHRLVPAGVLKWPNGVSNWFFGLTNARDRALLADILRDTDAAFLTWALDKIVTWQNRAVPANLTHLHGTRDRIFPARLVKPHAWVRGGGHFMTLNKASELSAALQQLLA